MFRSYEEGEDHEVVEGPSCYDNDDRSYFKELALYLIHVILVGCASFATLDALKHSRRKGLNKRGVFQRFARTIRISNQFACGVC